MLVNLTGDGKTWTPLSRVVEIREARDEDRNALAMQRARLAAEGRIGAMPEAPEGCTNSTSLVRTVALVEVGGGAIGVLYLTAELPTVLERVREGMSGPAVRWNDHGVRSAARDLDSGCEWPSDNDSGSVAE